MIGIQKASILMLASASAVVSRGDMLAHVRTAVGDMDVQLFSQDKPVTVANFVYYARGGLFQNTFFHRCAPGFVVQGGGYAVANPQDGGTFLKYFGVPTAAAITNEFAVGRRYSNLYGTLAMAKLGGDPNSATSQWFINLNNNSANLDNQNGGFTVFGRVLSGTNVLQHFNQLAANGQGIVDITKFYGSSSATAMFSALPVQYTGNVPPRYNDLYFTEVSLLEARVSLDAVGACVVSWTSVSNKLHTVETSESWPASWSSRYSVLGTGGTLAYTDNDRSASRRYYRVRVDY